MVSEKELHRTTLGDQLRGSRPEHRYSLLPRRAQAARVSRSVDRDSTTRTGFDQSLSNLHSEYKNPALPKSLLQRRFSLSAITAGSLGDRSIKDAEYDFYDTRLKSASHVRWSRKDVVYTAENMGFSREFAPRHTGFSSGYRDVSDVPKTNVDTRKLRSRTRFVDDYSSINDHALGADRRRRIKPRGSSVPRMVSGEVRSGHTIVHRRANSVARTYNAGVDRSRPSYSSKRYGAVAAIRTEDSDGFDIASFVLAPGEQFIPTNVSVSVLPSGKKAVTYTRFSQKGTGDQHNANVEIDHIIQRTNRLQVIFYISNSSKALNTRHVLFALQL